ncbi:phage baseplate assembly protein [Paraburkholderia sp. BR14263]|uniref:phage baseplate assembly protein n=1 Tax=unclassified Paraburkholderia TaxID=2615204 RepID=UPI0034CF7C0F
MNDDLYLTLNGQIASGWTDIRVTRGVERCPSDFEIGLTETYPGEVDEVVVQPGDACQVQLGDDLVITGYVDRYVPSFDSQQHQIKVTGRGKCQDLVDCSAVWPNGQISGTSALDVASKLAAYYGIDVSCDVSGLVAIPQFNIFIGETPFEIIERISRYSSLLVYDQPDGNLRLSQSGTVRAAGGLAQGVNVQSASIVYSAEERFSKYTAYAQSVATFGDLGVGPGVLATAIDEGVKRPRERYIVAEAVQGFQDLARRRAIWEMNRRIGRAAAVTVVTDSWRDADGVLWTPNTLVPIDLPRLKLQDEVWLIGDVTYMRDGDGTRAALTIMRPDAYRPEPLALQPMFVDGSVLQGQ